MTKDDANKLVFKLGECFRTMPPEVGAIIADGIEPFAVDVVDEAINRHVERFRFVVAAELFADIRDVTAQPSEERHKAAKLAYQEIIHAKSVERRNVDEELCGMYAKVQSLSPADRDRHKSEIIGALEKTSPFVAERLRDKDPQTSPTLAALIAQRMATTHLTHQADEP